MGRLRHQLVDDAVKILLGEEMVMPMKNNGDAVLDQHLVDWHFPAGPLQGELVSPVQAFPAPFKVTRGLGTASTAAVETTNQSPFRMITLEIRSSLDAVGFLAAVTTKLAAHGIAVNAVSAFHHDHLFVPAERAEEALALLREAAPPPFYDEPEGAGFRVVLDKVFVALGSLSG